LQPATENDQHQQNLQTDFLVQKYTSFPPTDTMNFTIPRGLLRIHPQNDHSRVDIWECCHRIRIFPLQVITVNSVSSHQSFSVQQNQFLYINQLYTFTGFINRIL